MFTKIHQQHFVGITSQEIWPLLTDINNWPQWHDDLEFCRLEGEFQVGNSFTLKPKGMRAVQIKLVDVKEGQEFTDCTTFPGAKMYDTHTLENKEEGVMLTNKLVVKGPLTWLWVKLVAGHVGRTIPQEVESLITLAKSRKLDHG